jgi:hypothetical protein
LKLGSRINKAPARRMNSAANLMAKAKEKANSNSQENSETQSGQTSTTPALAIKNTRTLSAMQIRARSFNLKIGGSQ